MNDVMEALSQAFTDRMPGVDFIVKRMLSNRNWFVGRSVQGRAAFVIESVATHDRPRQAGALRIEVGENLTASIDGEVSELKGCLILSLSSAEPELELYFSEICLALGERLDGIQDQDVVLQEIETLTQLFGYFPPNRESVKGLWGELLFISWLKDPNHGVEAWPERIDARFDFETKVARWDIKTTESIERKHHFSLGQLAYESAWVVSLLAEESPVGQSLSDVFLALQERLSEENRFKVKLRVASVLSSNLARTLKLRILEGELAPKLFKASDLPSPTIEESWKPFITGVRFSLLLPTSVDSEPLLDQTRSRLTQKSLATLLGVN